MSEELPKWEYRVQTVGGYFSAVKADELEMLLNEWGEQGWEVITASVVETLNKINLIAKRPLTRTARRFRSMPG